MSCLVSPNKENSMFPHTTLACGRDANKSKKQKCNFLSGGWGQAEEKKQVMLEDSALKLKAIWSCIHTASYSAVFPDEMGLSLFSQARIA